MENCGDQKQTLGAKREEDVTSLEELLDRIRHSCADHGSVSLGAILDSVGRRSFGPLLLFAGLITLAPVIGAIPGVPTLMAGLVFLTAGQLFMDRDHFWLPRIMLRRAVPEKKLSRGVDLLRKPCRFLDRWTRPRMRFLIQEAGTYGIAAACILIALAMPAMELVPLSAAGAGAALAAFGLALISQDGLLALIAITLTGMTAGVVLYSLV